MQTLYDTTPGHITNFRMYIENRRIMSDRVFDMWPTRHGSTFKVSVLPSVESYLGEKKVICWHILILAMHQKFRINVSIYYVQID